MIKVLLYGANGYMGKEVFKSIEKSTELQVVAGVDKDASSSSFPIYSDITQVKEKIDVIIDFSNHVAVKSILSYAKDNLIPTVLCTTGYTDEEKSLIEKVSKIIPIFFSANMSLGINVAAILSQVSTELLKDYDIEIVEKHHNRKLDAPSGTAILLANAMKAVNPQLYVNTNRFEEKTKRNKNEIGVSSVRGGNIVGVHEVSFIGQNEVITITHEAFDRAVFAEGALKAARFIISKEPKIYNMNDLIAQEQKAK